MIFAINDINYCMMSITSTYVLRKLFKCCLISTIYWDQGQLTVKGSSNRMLLRFQEPILG